MSTLLRKISKEKVKEGHVKQKPTPDKDVEGDDALGLPAHPKGRNWKARHVAAARMHARGITWPEISQAIGVQRSTAEKYPKSCDGWDILFRHFRAQYLAELEDRLFEPALNALYEIITTSKNEFAKIQAMSLVFGERNRAYGRIDSVLKRERAVGCEVGAAATPLVIDTAIGAPDQDSAKGTESTISSAGSADVPK